MSQDLFRFQKSINASFKYRPTHLSSHHFIPIFIWQDFFKFEIKNIEGSLCVFAKDKAGIFLYLPPLGKVISDGCVRECFDYMEQVNKGGSLTRIDNVSREELGFFSKSLYKVEDQTSEYIYVREKIAQLKGNVYKSQRSSYNQFAKNNEFRYLPYNKRMESECSKLYDAWSKMRLKDSTDEMHRYMIEDNVKVHRRAIKYYKKLGLVGRVVQVKNKIRAYTFGFPLNKDFFCVLFEITDVSLKGLPTFIFREFCADKELRGFKFINAMDDLGSENIKRAKLSFRPACFLPVYTIKVK